MGLRQSKSKTNTTNSTKYMSSVAEPISDGVTRYDPVHKDAVLCVGCHDNNGFLSAGEDKAIVSYQWQTGKRLHRWEGHTRDVTKVTYSPGMGRVFSGSRDKIAKMWSTEGALDSGTRVMGEILSFVGHTLVINGLATVDVSRRLCTGGRDNSVRLWDTETGGCIQEVTTSRNLVTHMVTIPRTELVLQTSEDKSIRLWDTRTLEESMVSKKKSYIQTCCDVSVDGLYCLSCSNGFSGQGSEATIWDVRNLQGPLREFKGHSQTASGCCFLPQCKSSPMFVTCSHDQTVKLWDQQTGDCLCTVSLGGSKQLTSIAANTDGSICVGSFEAGVHILSVKQSSGGSWDMQPVAQY